MKTELDQFTEDYIEAIYFTDTGDIDQPESDTEPSPDLIEKATADCLKFQSENEADLTAYLEKTGYTGGVDFWLTRNRHGAGFWDRGLGDLGKRLTDAAHKFGETDTYTGDDGLLYLA